MLIDIKREIAKHDDQAWYRLWRYDHEFRSYADSYAGRLVFVALFTTVNNRVTEVAQKLFGRTHCIDGPAVVYTNGDVHWYRNDLLHRDDGPAVIMQNGILGWYQNGYLHRDDGPAVIYASGTQCWYQNGKLHRDGDLHAVIHANGDQVWYQNGMIHRDNDLPAKVCANRDMYWYQNDKLHRDNGPNIVYDDQE